MVAPQRTNTFSASSAALRWLLLLCGCAAIPACQQPEPSGNVPVESAGPAESAKIALDAGRAMEDGFVVAKGTTHVSFFDGKVQMVYLAYKRTLQTGVDLGGHLEYRILFKNLSRSPLRLRVEVNGRDADGELIHDAGVGWRPLDLGPEDDLATCEALVSGTYPNKMVRELVIDLGPRQVHVPREDLPVFKPEPAPER